MKKLVLLFALCLATAQAFAADLYVREFGSGGAHWTITSAIAAASDGDRIIIEPKAGNIPYVENVTIDKSVTLMSETFGVKYILQGNITITPAIGRIVTIKNVDMWGYSIDSSTSLNGDRMVINIFESKAASINLGYDNISAIINNNVIGGEIKIVHGKVIANNVQFLIVSDETNSASISADPIYIIANSIVYYKYNRRGVELNSDDYSYHILNNIIRNNYTDVNFPIYSDLVYISEAKDNSVNYIHNNYFKAIGGAFRSNGINTPNFTSVNSIWDVRNNQFELTYYSLRSNVDDNSNAQFYAYFNKYKGHTTFNVDAQASNTTWSATTDLVDAGHPSLEFMDLDLTTNDVGVNGGSHAWDNYYPAGTTTEPQIYFLDMPHRVTTGTTIDVKAAGISK